MKALLRFGILGVLFFAAFAALYISYADVRDESLKKLLDRQMLLAKQAATGLEEFFSGYTNLLLQYSENADIINFNESTRHIFSTVYRLNSHQLKGITRYDSKGRIIYTFPERPDLIGKDISFQPHIKQVMTEKKPVLSNIFTSIQGYRTVSLGVPVFDKNEFVGGLSVQFDFEYIAEKYVGTINIGSSGYAWLMDKNGQLIFSPSFKSELVNVTEQASRFPDSKKMFEKMIRGESGFGEYTYDMLRDKHVEPVKKLAAFVPINAQNNFWSLCVAIPESEAYADLAGFYTNMLIIFALMFLAFALYISFVLKLLKLSVINTELEGRVQEEIEKRKEHEKMILQQAKFTSMGEMINAIAHQWRQPLTAIGFGVQEIGELAKEKTHSNQFIDDEVDNLMDIVMHMSETIDDFRNFFKPDKEKELLDVRQSLMSVYNIINSQFSAAGIQLSFTCVDQNRKYELKTEKDINESEKNLFTFEGFDGEIKQVFLNIFQNARDAILEQKHKKNINDFSGSVSVFVTSYHSHIDIDFLDNGGGISADHLDKVFDPYFTTKGESVGLGIGLFMSKTIVEEHMGGFLMVRNTKDGAKFTIRLIRSFPDIEQNT